MAIDFSNRDPKDKNGVFSVAPASKTGWIETDANGAWTGKFSSTKPANGSGWREVGYANVTLNDGRTFRAVLDESGQPISEIGDSTGTDTDRASAFAREQAAAGRGDQEGDTRGPQTGPNREVYRGGKWVTEKNPLYQQPSSSGDWRTEGTPDGQGGFDNSRPIMVRTVNGKREERALTSAELKDWNEAGQRTRNPGGKTDAEIEAERRANEPKPRQTRVNPADPTKVQEFDPTANGGTGGWVDAGPNAAGVQAQQPKRTEKPVQGKDGKQYTEVTEEDPRTGKKRTYYTDSTGKEVPLPGETQIQNAPPFNPDWNKPGLGIIEYASAVRARPDLTDEQKAKLIQEAHTLATATVSQGNAVLSAQQTEATRATTERGQDAGMANQRLSSSSSNFATAARQAADDTKYSLGSEAASVLPYYLAMAQATGQAYGGFNTPPPVRTGAAIGQMQGQTIPGLAGMSTFQPTGATPPGAAAAPDQAAAAANAATQMANPIFRPQPVAPPPSGAPGGPAGGNVQMAPAGGGLAAMLGNVGPWGGQPQQQPGQPTGLGALMMQRAGGYQPYGLNQSLLEAGIDPEVVAMMGGVG